MSFILVVEPDAQSATAIHKALASEGLEVRSVSDPDAALQMAAARAPKLVIVNGDVQQADRLLNSFARRQGGPGAVALVSAGDLDTMSATADQLLQKPFTDADLKQAVERCWEAERTAGAGSTGRMQFSSEEIFGDVLAELEEDVPTPPAAGTAKPDRGSAPAIERASVDGDVDSLLADTLAGLDLAPTIRAKTARPPTTGPAPSPPVRRRPKSTAKAKPAAVPDERVPSVIEPQVTPTEKVEPALVVESDPVSEPPAIAIPAASAAPVVEQIAVEALEPMSGRQQEEDDSRSRMVLIGAIAATALIGVLLVVLLNFRDDGAETTPSPAAGAEVADSAMLPVEESTIATPTVGEELEDEADGLELEDEAVGEKLEDAADGLELGSAATASSPPPTSPPVTAAKTRPQTAPRQATASPVVTLPPPTSAKVVPEMSEPVVEEPAGGSSSTVEIADEASGADATPAGDAATDGEAVDTLLATPPQATEVVTELGAETIGDSAVEVALPAEAVDVASDPTPPSTGESPLMEVSGRPESRTPTSANGVARESVSAVDQGSPPPAISTPAAQVQPGALVTVGPGVEEPKIVSFAKPLYPAMARRLHKQGTVVVSVLVDETGKVVEAKLVQTVMATFDSAVLRAAKRARFTPGTKNGVPVRMWRNIEVHLQADS